MIKQITLHHNFIKLASCVIGYSLWVFLAQHQNITVTQTIPLCFFHTNETYLISAPESVTISVSGKRKDIYRYNPEENAFHINASRFTEGKHHIQLTNENLFLPDSIKLVQLIPSSITLNVTK